MTSKKTPPKFFTPYKEWKEKLLMWKCLATVALKEQAILVRLTCFEENITAERAVSKLTCTELNTDTGLDKLLEVLDETFAADVNDESYENYVKFTNFTRQDH